MNLPSATSRDEPWFAATPAGAGVTLLTEPFVDEFLRANLWLVARPRPRPADRQRQRHRSRCCRRCAPCKSKPGKPLLAVVTHAHSDHMGGLHEFADRLVHRLEAEALARAADAACLVSADPPTSLEPRSPQDGLRAARRADHGVAAGGLRPGGLQSSSGRPRPHVLDEGDTIDLGDRVFAVLHLPGHSPGSIGLWEEKTGILFSGDAVYRDGPLLDQMPGSDVGAYLKTMERMRELPVSIVHAGHDPSFAQTELTGITEHYLASRGR